jgi:hypothetical protein
LLFTQELPKTKAVITTPMATVILPKCLKMLDLNVSDIIYFDYNETKKFLFYNRRIFQIIVEKIDG